MDKAGSRAGCAAGRMRDQLRPGDYPVAALCQCGRRAVCRSYGAHDWEHTS